MLISFTIKNYLSFKERTTFSMLASPERRFSHRIAKVKTTKILPIAAMFGGNASGKSNFIQAMGFIKNFVACGLAKLDEPIPVTPFRLDPKNEKSPCEFSLLFTLQNTIYEYTIIVDSKRVYEEKLIKIQKAIEKVIYSRVRNDDEEFGWDVFMLKTIPEYKKLNYILKTSADNRLFLSSVASQKGLEYFQSVYDWFDKQFIIISPKYTPFNLISFTNQESKNTLIFNEMLSLFDTGIQALEKEEISLNDETQVAQGIFPQMRDEMPTALPSIINSVDVNTLEDDGTKMHRLLAQHKNVSGDARNFSLSHESDGTRRLLHLLPIFLMNQDTVFIIDELDRSLHTLISHRFIELFLSKIDEDSRNQLIFTTHNVLLMDQDLLRRDEMWIVDKNSMGESSLSAINDYEAIRFDTDLRKKYLAGRFGGIPRNYVKP